MSNMNGTVPHQPSDNNITNVKPETNMRGGPAVAAASGASLSLRLAHSFSESITLKLAMRYLYEVSG